MDPSNDPSLPPPSYQASTARRRMSQRRPPSSRPRPTPTAYVTSPFVPKPTYSSSSRPSKTSKPSSQHRSSPPERPTHTLTPSGLAHPLSHPFDPYNSSSTGHQRAESRLTGSTDWRASRNKKLSEQYRAGLDGGKRVSDTVGAGSEGFGVDGRRANGGWERGAVGLRGGGQRGLMEFFGVGKGDREQVEKGEEVMGQVEGKEGARRATDAQRAYWNIRDESDKTTQVNDVPLTDTPAPLEHLTDNASTTTAPTKKPIFHGLVFYINGSTFPTISDHKLKRLLAEHGAETSIALGRRKVTHVILGKPNGHATNSGCGGGLAATKIQKEVARVGGKGVKFVGVEWVVESVKAGVRLSETPFTNLSLGGHGQESVWGKFGGRGRSGEF